jgi:acyl-CoA synthetase (AMP-forming)/AMP-acid ligase II/1-acyl-sn-glycerol-3-phosphate acyltransferase/acyl carrier protein
MSSVPQSPPSSPPDEAREPVAETAPSGSVPLLSRFLAFLLRFRYFIMAYGDPVPTDGGPYLILANHPTFIDPLIVYAQFAHLRPRPFMDETHFMCFGGIARRFEPIIAPDMSRGGDPAVLEQVVRHAAESLVLGRSVLMWPGGRLQRDGREVMKGRSGVWRILKAVEERGAPGPELILVRVEGLWGSRFSRGPDTDERVDAFRRLFRLLPAFFLSCLFQPRRSVRLMLRRHRPNRADRANVERLNAVLAAWFAAGNQSAALVPVASPATPSHHPPSPSDGAAESVADADIGIKQALELLAPYGAHPAVRKETRLAEDLGMDSLGMVQLILRIEETCGYAPAPVELQTVADVALLLLGKSAPVPLPVIAEMEPSPVRLPPLAPVHELFSRRGDVTDLALGRHFPRSALMAYSKAVSLQARDLQGRNLGIALPAGAAAMAAFAGCLGAGKTPVMLNYASGAESLARCADIARITHVLTSRRMYGRGVPPGSRPVYLEDADTGSLGRKAFASFFGFDWNGALDDIAVILFTSDSEGTPRGVPLTHRNLMSNLRALLSVCMDEPLSMKRMSLLCCLPPFHCLGLLTNLLLPLVCGVPGVYVADPGNAPALAKAAVTYNTTHFAGTPGILRGILQAAQAPLPFTRVILGEESCPLSTKELFAAQCPGGMLIESYGSAECSAVVTLNDRQVPDSVGRVLPGFETRIHEGRLYVRGDSVFSGYVGGPDPRTGLPASTWNDWYPTGDFFGEQHGDLYLRSRSGRVVLRGNEPVFLDAAEKALNERLAPDATRRIALVDDPDGRIIACGNADADPARINEALRAAGFGPACMVDEVRELPLPVSPPGMVDHHALKAALVQAGKQREG